MPVGRREAIVLPNDPDWIKLWEKRLDPERTSVLEFMQLFKVPTKRVKAVRGARAMTPFVPYDFQREGVEIILGQWAHGEGGKTLGGKARQEGETTAKLLLAWERFLRGGGGTWNYFSYDDAHSIEAFSLLLKLKRQVPDWVYAFLVGESAPGKYDGGGVWTKKSHRCLELSFPGALGASLLQCATAGGEFSGSGSAPRGVFLDEFTKYPKSVKVDHTGISEGWMDVPGNVFAYWGTGQGNDEYATTFMDHYYAEKPPVDGFIAYFRSWLRHPDRSRPFESDAARVAFAETVGEEKRFGQLDETALVLVGATREELHWRRAKLAGPSFKFDLKLFARENPLIPEDMFQSESGSVFQVELLKTHDRAVVVKEQRARVGDFVEHDDDVEFIDNRAGSWTLYEERRDDLIACWGGDSASGKSRTDGGRKEADFADGKFKEVYSGRTIAHFSAHREGAAFGIELLNAARYFRWVQKDGKPCYARGFPEVNNESGMAMMMGMQRYCEDRDLDFFDFVMVQQHMVLANGLRPDPTPGWRTTRSGNMSGVTAGSKGILVGVTQAFIGEVGVYDATNGTPYDRQTLGQMYHYERDDKGASEAASGFDDAVSSEMLSLVARDYLIHGKEIPLESKVRPMAAMEPFDAYQIGTAAQQRRAEQQGRSKFLGQAF